MKHIFELTRSFLLSTAWTMSPPAMYATFYICFVLSTGIIAILLAKHMTRKAEASRIRFLSVLGWIMIILEVYPLTTYIRYSLKVPHFSVRHAHI